MQIWSRKKKSNNYQKIGFGKVLDSIWERFGPVWAVFGALLDASWPLLGRWKLSFFHALVHDELQESFRIAFGKVWGGFREGFGRIWGLKFKTFASHGRLLSILYVPCCLTFCYRNPRAASLRPAERHNFPVGNAELTPPTFD